MEENNTSSESRPGNDLCWVCKKPIKFTIVETPDADIPKWVHLEGETDHPAIKKQ